MDPGGISLVSSGTQDSLLRHLGFNFLQHFRSWLYQLLCWSCLVLQESTRAMSSVQCNRNKPRKPKTARSRMLNLDVRLASDAFFCAMLSSRASLASLAKMCARADKKWLHTFRHFSGLLPEVILRAIYCINSGACWFACLWSCIAKASSHVFAWVVIWSGRLLSCPLPGLKNLVPTSWHRLLQGKGYIEQIYINTHKVICV